MSALYMSLLRWSNKTVKKKSWKKNPEYILAYPEGVSNITELKMYAKETSQGQLKHFELSFDHSSRKE